MFPGSAEAFRGVWLATSAVSWLKFSSSMSMFSSRLIVLTLGLAIEGAGIAGEFKLPPIDGELSGDFKPLKISTAPALHWTAEMGPLESGSERRVVKTKVEGPGVRLAGILDVNTPTVGSWQILEGEVDIATWFPAANETSPDALGGLTAKGTAQIQGNGVLRDGELTGTVKISLRDGRLENVAAGWALDGVALTAELWVEANRFRVKSVKPFDLTIATITTSRFGARNVFLRGVLKEDQAIEFSEARVEIAGGEITLDPTTLSLAPLAVEGRLHIFNVGMEDIAALVPAGLSSAHGRIDGDVRVGWSSAGGFRVGAGDLSLGQSEPATVRLAPAPGFLSRSMPKRFEPLPSWTGPLSRWFSADNPVYTDMAAIELGKAPLRVESLKVRLTPDGDLEGRTATVRMVARPLKREAGVKSVNIDVNVVGPLDSLLQLGLNQKYSVEAH